MLSWLIGALFRRVHGCLTPTDVALSVCEGAVELELCGAPNPRNLLRMALIRVDLIIQEGKEERTKEFSRTSVSLYRIWGGL